MRNFRTFLLIQWYRTLEQHCRPVDTTKIDWRRSRARPSRDLAQGSNNDGSPPGTMVHLFLKIFFSKIFMPTQTKFNLILNSHSGCLFGVIWADLRGRSRIGLLLCAVQLVQSVGAWGGWAPGPQTKLGVRYTLAICAILRRKPI